MKDEGRRMRDELMNKNLIFILHNSSFILRRKCGFTLLEVLIALAVIGALLVTLISTLNYHLSLVARQETITVATLLAKDKMAALSKSPEENKGFFDSPYDRYSYET